MLTLGNLENSYDMKKVTTPSPIPREVHGNNLVSFPMASVCVCVCVCVYSYFCLGSIVAE